MTQRRGGDVVLRLGVEEQEVVQKALRAVGQDGEKMADKIEKASKEANRGLKAIDGVVVDLNRGMENLADRAGFAAGPLKALGPAGVAAAAGIAGLVLGLGAAVRMGKEAVDTFSEIGNAADRMDVAVETYQALTAEANAQGLAVSELETGLKALEERQSQIILQQGELFSRLKDTNPELLRQLEGLDNNEDRLRAVAKALKEAGSETERNTIAYAAFGEAGVSVSRVLLATGGDMDALIEKGQELGLVMDEDLIRNSQELSTELEVAGKVMDLQLKQAFVDFAPVALETIQFLGDIATGLSNVSNRMREVAERSARFNRERLDAIQNRLTEGGIQRSIFDGARDGSDPLSEADLPRRFNNVTRREMRRLIREFNETAAIETERAAAEFVRQARRELAGLTSDQLGAELEKTKRDIAAVKDGAVVSQDGDVLFGTDNSERQRRVEVIEALIVETEARETSAAATREQLAAEKALEERRKQEIKDARELETLRRQAAQLLAELGDATLAMALKEEELAKFREAGLLTLEQSDQILQSYRDRVTGVTEATERWRQVVEGADTEVEKLQNSVQQLKEDFATGKLGETTEATELYTEAVEALSEALGKAQKAELEATDAHKAATEIREKLADVRKAAMSDEQLFAAEQARIEQLVKNGNLTRDEATEHLRNYRNELRQTRGEVNLLEQAETVLDGIESGRIKTVGDLRRAIGAMIVDIVRQYALAQAQIGGQGFGGFLGGIFGNIFGTGGLNPSGTPPPINPHSIPVSHSGNPVSNAPRAIRSFGSRLASNERMMITQTDEEVITGGDRRKLISYLRESSRERFQPNDMMMAGTIPLDISIRVRRDGAGDVDADVQATQSGSNGLDLDVLLRDAVRSEASSGGLNDALAGQGFVRRDLR